MRKLEERDEQQPPSNIYAVILWYVFVHNLMRAHHLRQQTAREKLNEASQKRDAPKKACDDKTLKSPEEPARKERPCGTSRNPDKSSLNV